ncbi:MAG: monofunctional biosynthetic peptidoglycan transglycosylase [Pseudomonadota bacterium]
MRAIKWLLIVAVVVVALPLLLTVLYRFEFVRPVSALMVTNKVAGEPVSRLWVEIDDVSPNLKYAVLMSEDGQFCNHHGIDFGELKGVIERALDGEVTRGASTITMQTAKNLFLWGGRSYIRKALEFPLAVWIDLVIPKKRIMEIYLNIAEWGPGIYGADQAAGFHFGKNADELSRREGALLAVTLPNPYVRDPSRPSQRLNNVARVIERRARQSGGFVDCLD